jgi:fucose 4-O-acetylase-like acetyltransferase
MDTPPEYKLYTVGQITLAAFLGSPFPGFWLASRNFKALGQAKESRRSLMWGIGLTLACFIVAVILPGSFPAIAVSLPFVIATRSMAKQWFGHNLTAHVAAGGRIGSWWISVLVGVVALVLILSIVIGAVLLSSSDA